MKKLLPLLLLCALRLSAQTAGAITSSMITVYGTGTATPLGSPRYWFCAEDCGSVEFDCHLEFCCSGAADSIKVDFGTIIPQSTDHIWDVCYYEATVTGGNIQESATWYMKKNSTSFILHRMSPYPGGGVAFANARNFIRFKGSYH